MKQKAIQELSLDTQTLKRLLREAEIGQIVSYSEMSSAIGRDVPTEARGNLRTARRQLLREHNMVFGPVLGVGMKRLDDAGKIESAHGHARRGRSQYRMAVRTVAAVDDFDALPNDQKIRHSLVAAQAGAILQLSSPTLTRKLEAAVSMHTQKSFKPKESLELMKGSLL